MLNIISLLYWQVSSLDLVKAAAKKFVDFVNNGPSPYHGICSVQYKS